MSSSFSVSFSGFSQLWISIISLSSLLFKDRAYLTNIFYITSILLYLVLLSGRPSSFGVGLDFLEHVIFKAGEVTFFPGLVFCRTFLLTEGKSKAADRINVILKDRRELRERERRFREMAIRDALTGLFNRRWFDSKLAGEIEHASRTWRPLCLIIPGTDKNTALQIAERIRRAVESESQLINSGLKASITLILGLSVFEESDDAAAFTAKADTALYRAKQPGRNRSVVFNETKDS